ncbi:hypothetical protein [Brevibacterium luteolum]|uniref:hypothetical protein n=1 Tax=Brevibacterium luteolum TaxID=199591 RepID=UPI001C244213|nr:hypothetical protein [Brevibacterium luteolum]MBU8578984.1 hypothetical protein [Brevibacterium luteolum]
MSFAHAYPIHRRWVIFAAVSVLRWARRKPKPRPAPSHAELHREAILRREASDQVERERHAAQLRALSIHRPII